MRSRLCRAAGLAARSSLRADAALTSLPALGARGFAAAAGVVEAPSRAKALLLLLPGGVAAGLGAWQLQRREWKEEQLAERARQLGAEPLPLRAVAGAGAPPAGEWRRVLCKGELRHDAAAYVGPRVRTIAGTACAGYLLIEPLVAADGSGTVLLNRGWVPAAWRTSPPPAARNPCCVNVVGVVRASETPSAFVPANAGDEWFWVDVPALAAAAKLPPGTLLVEALAPPGHASPGAYPSPQAEASLLRFSVMPDDHRNYAITWFTLAAATGVIASLAIRGKRAELARRAVAAAAKAG